MRQHLLLWPALAAIAPLASPAQAQILERSTRTEPRFWTSGAIGLFDIGTIVDSRSASEWNFSSAAQFRASVEYAMGRGTAVGVSGAWARMPLRYRPRPDLAEPGMPLPAGDGFVNAASLMATLHGGGGGNAGLHQVIEIAVGVIRFSDFEVEERVAGGAGVRPGSDTEFAFSIGGGFGYSLGPRARIVLVQEFGLLLHQRESLPNDVSTSIQHRVTRIGARVGLANRPR